MYAGNGGGCILVNDGGLNYCKWSGLTAGGNGKGGTQSAGGVAGNQGTS